MKRGKRASRKDGKKERKERKRKGGGCPVSEEVEASAQGGRVPDHLSLRKDISFFAPIVPPSAETTKLCQRGRMGGPATTSAPNWVQTSQKLVLLGISLDGKYGGSRLLYRLFCRHLYGSTI